jgi:predicted membrane protein
MNKTWISIFIWSILLALFLVTVFFGGLTLYALFTYHSYDIGGVYSITVHKKNPSFDLTVSSGFLCVFLITVLFFILVFSLAQLLRTRRNDSKAGS